MYDLVVIGGGAGGIETALRAAGFGARVALIERHELGGQRTFSAGVPSKALLRAAAVAHAVRKAAAFGIQTGPAEVDFAAVMARVRAVIAAAARRLTAAHLAEHGIDVVRGSAAFEAYDTVVVDGQTRVHGRRFVIATGSRAAVPAAAGFATLGALDSGSVWQLESLPRTLVVLGDGPEALEFAQAFRRLGSEVTLLAEAPRLLPTEAPEVSACLEAALKAEGVAVQCGVQLRQATTRNEAKVVAYRAGETPEIHEASGTHLLLAGARWANIEGLNLEAVGVHADREHGIEVDDYLQTHALNIFALGDVIGHDRWAHAAERAAAAVVRNAVLGLPRKLDLRGLPRVVFTDPEVAAVGATAAQAREEHPEAIVLEANPAEQDRALIDAAETGFAQVVVQPSGKLLGAVLVGPQAASALQELVLALEHGLSLAAVAETVHPYPSYVETIHALAKQFRQIRQRSGVVQRALRWFHGFQAPRKDGSTAPAPESTAGADLPHGGH